MDEMLKKQDVLDAIYEKMEKTDKPDVVLGLAAAMSTVKQMEAAPVNPAEKVGHWIKLDNCSNSGYYCSECHKRVVKEGWSDTVKKIKYCSNCGAKMQEVEE